MMKKACNVICLGCLLILVCLLSACGVDPADTSLPSGSTPSINQPSTPSDGVTDPTVNLGVVLSDPDGWAVNFTGSARGVTVGDGYYYIDNGFLRYLDMNTGVSVYLCSDVLCPHNDPDICEAGILNSFAQNLMFFEDNALYYIDLDSDGSSVLMSRNADGLGLQRIARLGESLMAKDRSVTVNQYMISGKWLYYQAAISAAVNTEFGLVIRDINQVLCHLNLKTGKDEILLEFDGGALNLVSVKEDAMLYLIVDLPKAEPLYDEDGLPYLPQEYYDQLPDSPSRLMHWNQKTGESTLLLENRHFDMQGLKCYGGKVVYSNMAVDRRFAYDLKTGEVTEMDVISGTIINEDYMLHSKDGMQSILNLKTGRTYPISMQGQSFTIYSRSDKWLVFSVKLKGARKLYYMPIEGLADGIQADEIAPFPE